MTWRLKRRPETRRQNLGNKPAQGKNYYSPKNIKITNILTFLCFMANNSLSLGSYPEMNGGACLLSNVACPLRLGDAQPQRSSLAILNGD